MSIKDEMVGVDFIRTIIAKDIRENKRQGMVHTRFPPEPNGYLHIGHAKSICLNFGIAEEHVNGRCNLRFDDSDPEKESSEYVDAIIEDVRWLGFSWGDRLFYASDYYAQLYDYAVLLIKKAKAYVDDLPPEKLREYRGTLTRPGKESPNRDRSIEENLDLFERMRAGEFQEGSYFLRAKIDMASPNMNMRDPTIYRIKKKHHYRLGDAWCIYPMYDFTHCICDALEGITHSLCTLEFEDHRALYDWYLDQLPVPCHPQQIEFSRLNLEYTVTSKRKLDELIKADYVNGWDDPRMPTISGMRRRGYTPTAIREFCARIGLTKNDTIISMDVLESCVRADLNEIAPRVLAVLNPLKVVIENYPDEQVETIEAPYHPARPDMGYRALPFSKELYIERDDFLEDPPKKFFRLAPGREVRLRYAYFITCNKVIKNEKGEIIELRCRYDPETKGGSAPDGRKVKGTLHWLSKRHAIAAEVRLYDRLFTVPLPEQEKKDWQSLLNKNALKVIDPAFVEPSLSTTNIKTHVQFERLGYFFLDQIARETKKMIFNRAATLKESSKKNKRPGAR